MVHFLRILIYFVRETMTDCLFYLLGFSWFAYVVLTTDLFVWMEPNHSDSKVSHICPYTVSEHSLFIPPVGAINIFDNKLMISK